MTADLPAIMIRMLARSETERTGEIDRSESIAESYCVRNGKLERVATPEWVPAFDPKELKTIIERQKDILQRDGAVFGAFEGNTLAGVASVDRKIMATGLCKMDILYVSRPYRKLGLGVQLLQACKEQAKAYGAAGLYISATPTRGTVDFYLRQGAVLLERPDPVLFRMEPEDIHLGLMF